MKGILLTALLIVTANTASALQLSIQLRKTYHAMAANDKRKDHRPKAEKKVMALYTTLLGIKLTISIPVL